MNNNNVTIAIVFADTGDVFLSNMIIPSWEGGSPVYKHLYSFNVLHGGSSATITAPNLANPLSYLLV